MLKRFWYNFLYWMQQNGAKADCLLLVLLGALSALALQPMHAVPVIFFTIPAFFFIINKALTTKGVFVRVWFFHFGYFLAGLYWIAAALLIDINNNWWALPFALGSLPALMAFYPAAAAALWHRMAWKGAPRIIAFIVLWIVAEWVRGWAFTGFPWNLWGYVWTAYLPVLQSVALFGIYGLSFVTLVLVFLPVLLYQHRDSFSVRFFCGLFLAAFIALVAWGFGRLSHDTAYDAHAKIVRIVQPDIKQEVKWDRAKIRENLIRTWALTIKKTDVTPDIIVWPETTITLADTMDVRMHEENIRTMLPPGSFLATGVMDVQLSDDGTPPSFFNRISFYDSTGRRAGTYDKTHLVPFGEFLPYQKYWPVRPVAFRSGGVTRGDGLHTYKIPGLPPFSALICYEVLFPGEVVVEKDRPSWILNVTNDAWYGDTSGPHQHLALTQARAVEEGLPLVRAANTGISAIFDPYGRMIAHLDLNQAGVIDHALPRALKPTLYARYGNKIFFIMLFIFFGFAWDWQRRTITKVPHVH